MGTKGTGNRYNEEIQALRAIAIAMVVVSHVGWLFPWNREVWEGIGKGLYVGVDLFLCLSGFVIAKSLGRRLVDTKGLDFWRQTAAFWVRRLYRILPSAWVWLFIPMLFYSMVSGYDRDNATDVVAAIMQVENVRLWHCAYVAKAHCGSFGHYWSLSLEEQFYLLFPLLALVFRKRLYIALMAAVVVQVFMPRPLGSIFGAVKTDALLLGVLLAVWSETPAYRVFDPRLSSSPLRFVLPVVLLVCLVGMTRYEPVPFFIGMAAVASALIVWLCSYDAGYFIGAGPLRRAMVWVGERSFAIYLIHPFVFWIVREPFAHTFFPGAEINGTYTLRFAAAGIILLFALVELSYRLVEIPLRRRGAARSHRMTEAMGPVAVAPT